MKREDKQYAVLGLGIFGSTVAKTLSAYNYEVVAVDADLKCVERMADIVTQAVQCDITDKEELRAAGVGDCDIAIVGPGSHLEATVMAIINLKELGVPYIIAKAKNKRYMQIFSKVGADRVVRPEKEMGVVVAKSLLSNSIIDMIDIIGVRKHNSQKLIVSLDADYVIEEDDQMVVIADTKTIEKFDYMNKL